MICHSCEFEVDGRTGVRCSSCNHILHKDCAIREDGVSFCDVCYTIKQEGGTKMSVAIPDVIRRSYIETYRTCPYKFYLQVIGGKEAPPTIYTQLGIDLHEMFDLASNGGIDKSTVREQFVNIFMESYRKDFKLSTEEYERFMKRGIDSIDTFFHINSTMPTPLMTEQKIEFALSPDLPRVSITMDRINEVDGELEIVDYKTGAVMVGTKLSTDLQAPLYISAVQQFTGRTVRSFTLYYLAENKVRTFVRNAENGNQFTCTVGKREYHIYLTESLKEVQRLFSRIKSGDFAIPKDTKKMYFPCKMCHLKEQGICQGADIESWNRLNQGVS